MKTVYVVLVPASRLATIACKAPLLVHHDEGMPVGRTVSPRGGLELNYPQASHEGHPS